MKVYSAIKVVCGFNKEEMEIDTFTFAYKSKEELHKHLLAEGFEYRDEDWEYILTETNGYRLAKGVEISVVM